MMKTSAVCIEVFLYLSLFHAVLRISDAEGEGNDEEGAGEGAGTTIITPSQTIYKITNGEYHVSADSDGTLYLSKTDTVTVFVEYSDSSLRNEAGDLCITADGGNKKVRFESCTTKKSQVYSSHFKSYEMGTSYCWTKSNTAVIAGSCTSQGFERVLQPEQSPTPSPSSSSSSSSSLSSLSSSSSVLSTSSFFTPTPTLTHILIPTSSVSVRDITSIAASQSAVSLSSTSADIQKVYTIKNGEFHVSLENNDRLFLSTSDPPLKLYKYPDGTMRNKEGRKCVKVGAGFHVILSADCRNSFTYDANITTYRVKNAQNYCWTKRSTNVTVGSCDGPQGFYEVLSPAMSSDNTRIQPSAALSSDNTNIQPSAVHSPTMNSQEKFQTLSLSLPSQIINLETSRIIPSQSSRMPLLPSSVRTANFTRQGASSHLYLANGGQQCRAYCEGIGQFCSSVLATGNSDSVFIDNGVICKDSTSMKRWTNDYDPSFYIGNKTCAGYVSVNESVACVVRGFNHTNVRRLCKCIKSADEDKFSPWTPWSTCTVICNGGTQMRTRVCNADSCNGGTAETRTCNTQLCPIDGGFSAWSSWSACSVTCGGGSKNRSRTCNNPYPQHGGLDCFGDRSKSDICSPEFCPVHGHWTRWTEWSACDKPCNTGMYRRWRFCTNPTPLYGGLDCIGISEDNKTCNTNKCPAERISVDNIRFDQAWNSSMAVRGSAKFDTFYNNLAINTRRVFSDSDVNSTYLFNVIDSLRQGSIIATFTLFFTGLDSFQILLLQDSIDGDKYLGKLKIIGSNSTYDTTVVPSAPPANFSLTPLTTSSIRAGWNEVPSGKTNGNISGYILFYREKLLRSEPYKSIATVQTTVTLLGLKIYTEYTFRILGYNENGNGIASAERDVYTKESVPSQPPKSVNANGTSGFTAIVDWVHISQEYWNGQPVGTLIKYDNSQGHNGSVSVTYPQNSVTLNGLIPVSTYVIDVCETTNSGPGPCQRVQASTLPTPPSKGPEYVTVYSFIGHDTIRITWKHIKSQYVHGDLKGYKIIFKLLKIAGQSIVTAKSRTNIIHPSKVETALTGLEANSKYSIAILAYNEYGNGITSSAIVGETCACPQIIYTNFASSAPYIYRDKSGNMQGLFVDILNNVTDFICGNCQRPKQTTIDFKTNGKNGWAEKRSLNEMKKDIDDYVHISFPVFGSTELTSYYGYAFVPVFSHPGVVYFTIKDSLTEQVNLMILDVLNTWPIFLINILFVTVSGFIIWALEFRENPEEFPPNCVRGVLNGMYWAFITMGTHGYGDLTPRAIASRVFAVIWIFIGMVNFAIFVGALTTAITATQISGDAKIYGVEVAAIHDSVAYKVGIYRNAEVNAKATYKTIEAVASALKGREVRGALVDVYSAAKRSDLFTHADIVAKKNIKYPSAYGFVLSGGMKNAAPTFRDYLKVHANSILNTLEQSTAGLEVNEESGETVSMFDSSSPMFSKTITILCVLLLIAIALGLLLYYCKQNKQKKTKVHSEILQEFEKIEEMCDENLTQFNEALEEKVGKLADVHLEERMSFLVTDKKCNSSKLINLVIKLRRWKQQCIDKEMLQKSLKTQEPCCSRSVAGRPMMMNEEEAHVDSPSRPASLNASMSSHYSFSRIEKNKDLSQPVD